MIREPLQFIVLYRFYGPSLHKGPLKMVPTPGHNRLVKGSTFCPWCDKEDGCGRVDYCKGTWRCLNCNREGYLVLPTSEEREGYVSVQFGL